MTEDHTYTATQLDQLRAGLLDDRPELKAAVQAALLRDTGLASQNELFDRVREQLERSRQEATRLNNQLRLRRRRVLTGKAGMKPRRFTLPQMALATATSVILTLVLVLWFNDTPPGTGIITVAGTGPAETSVPVQEVAAGGIDLDLANNVDFYVWMQNQRETSIDMPRKGT